MLKTASVTCFLLVGFRFIHVNIVAKKRESSYIQYLAGKVDFEHLPRDLAAGRWQYLTADQVEKLIK